MEIKLISGPLSTLVTHYKRKKLFPMLNFKIMRYKIQVLQNITYLDIGHLFYRKTSSLLDSMVSLVSGFLILETEHS
jgi:hypothetical protein